MQLAIPLLWTVMVLVRTRKRVAVFLFFLFCYLLFLLTIPFSPLSRRISYQEVALRKQPCRHFATVSRKMCAYAQQYTYSERTGHSRAATIAMTVDACRRHTTRCYPRRRQTCNTRNRREANPSPLRKTSTATRRCMNSATPVRNPANDVGDCNTAPFALAWTRSVPSHEETKKIDQSAFSLTSQSRAHAPRLRGRDVSTTPPPPRRAAAPFPCAPVVPSTPARARRCCCCCCRKSRPNPPHCHPPRPSHPWSSHQTPGA